MLRVGEYLSAFFAGALIYPMLELFFRGHTHWAMSIVGGCCLLTFHLVNRARYSYPLILKCVFSCLIITAYELIAGCILNLHLGLRVWSYIRYPFNLLGQVCPHFSILWFWLGIPMNLLSRKLLFRFNSRSLPAGGHIRRPLDKNERPAS